ncbi:hypothetical protein F5X96DRAFT_674205 [Biscogniauxia mediterranea]|nr:hypothetical protein F5X96DRAFT_674205 [Biscogniauxia mediterranea]
MAKKLGRLLRKTRSPDRTGFLWPKVRLTATKGAFGALGPAAQVSAPDPTLVLQTGDRGKLFHEDSGDIDPVPLMDSSSYTNVDTFVVMSPPSHVTASVSAGVVTVQHLTPSGVTPAGTDTANNVLQDGSSATAVDRWTLHAVGIRRAPRNLDKCHRFIEVFVNSGNSGNVDGKQGGGSVSDKRCS